MEELMRPEVGQLPADGYLANAYVPYQKAGSPQYTKDDALKFGTLFPGLNLPYKNYVPKRDLPNTQMVQLMTLGFVLVDLGLYLDTHPGDTEALELHNNLVRMYKAETASYEKAHGPITMFTEMNGRYTWINEPWPWEVR